MPKATANKPTVKPENQILRQLFTTPAEQKLHQTPVTKPHQQKEVVLPTKMAEELEPTHKAVTSFEEMAIVLDMQGIEEAVKTAMKKKEEYLERAYQKALAEGKEVERKAPKEIKLPTLTQNVVKVIARTLEEFSKKNEHISLKDIESGEDVQVEQQVSFTCKDFQERCGIKYTTTAVQILKDAAIVMHNIGYIVIDEYIKSPPKCQEETDEQASMLEAYNQSEAKDSGITTLRPFSKTKYRDGVFAVNFDIDYARALRSCYIMKLPDLYYKLNPSEHPHAAKMLFYFYSLCRQKKNLKETTLKVRTILERTGFDIAGAIAARQRGQRLQEPFEKNMDALFDVLTWEYTDVGGQILPRAKIDRSYSIDDYLNLNVKINIRPAALPYPPKTKAAK